MERREKEEREDEKWRFRGLEGRERNGGEEGGLVVVKRERRHESATDKVLKREEVAQVISGSYL